MASLLTYTIAFAFLFVLVLVALTWTLYVWYQEHQCVANPNIWCSNEWRCNNLCPANLGKNPCFSTATNLASCLFGPTSAIANKCNASTGDPLTGECQCAIAGQNCLTGCNTNLPNVNCKKALGV